MTTLKYNKPQVDWGGWINHGIKLTNQLAYFARLKYSQLWAWEINQETRI